MDIERLLNRLYEQSRNIRAITCDRPVFVLLTKGPADRKQIEYELIYWVNQKYGLGGAYTKIQHDAEFKNSTLFNLSEIASGLMLIDVGPTPEELAEMQHFYNFTRPPTTQRT